MNRALDVAERQIRAHGDQRRRHRAGQDQCVVVGAQAAKNIAAQPAGIDRRGNRRGADADHRGDAHPGDNHAEGERQLDLKQQLAVGHAHAAAGVADRRIDVADAGKSIANNRQERVQHQCHDRRPRADAADDLDVKQINIERNQKSEQREARHGLHDVGETEHWLTEARLASQKDAEGHADQNRDAGRNCDEK